MSQLLRSPTFGSAIALLLNNAFKLAGIEFEDQDTQALVSNISLAVDGFCSLVIAYRASRAKIKNK